MVRKRSIAKPWPELEVKASLPDWEVHPENVKALGIRWANCVSLKFPPKNFATSTGLVCEEI